MPNGDGVTRFEDAFEKLSEESREYIRTVIHSLSTAQHQNAHSKQKSEQDIQQQENKKG